MDGQSLGRMLMVLGLVVAGLGLFFYLGGNRWFPLGRLPGDLRFGGEHTKIYFSITSSIVISIVLTALLYLVSRFR